MNGGCGKKLRLGFIIIITEQLIITKSHKVLVYMLIQDVIFKFEIAKKIIECPAHDA
jgi:hypothetical protein